MKYLLRNAVISIVTFFLFTPILLQADLNLIARWGVGPSKAMTLIGDTLVYSNGSYLKTADISNPDDIVQLSSVLLPNVVTSLASMGSYVYSTCDGESIQIHQVDDQGNPIEVTEFEVQNITSELFISGNYLIFFTSHDDILHCYDITHPTLPTEVSTLQCNLGGKVSDIELKDDILVVSTDGNGVHFVDIADVETPELVGNFLGGRNVSDFEIENNIALVAIQTSFWLFEGYAHTYNITDILNPIFLDSLILNDNPMAVSIQSGHAFVATKYRDLGVFEVSSEGLLDSIGNHEPQSGLFEAMLGENGKIYYSHNSGTIQILGYDETAGIELYDSILTGDNLESIHKNGEYIYTSSGDAGLIILDASNPLESFEISRHNHTDALFSVTQNDYTYYGGHGGILHVLDVSNPSSPVSINSIDLDFGMIRHILIEGNHAFVSAEGVGLYIFDITDPANLVELAYIGAGNLPGVAVRGNYLYVSRYIYDMDIYDISDIANPLLVNTYETGGNAGFVYIENDRLYLQDGGTLLVLDISDPANPLLLGQDSSNQGYPGNYFFVENSICYLTGGVFQILDVSDPGNIVELEVEIGFDFATGVTIDENYIYVSYNSYGMCVFERETNSIDTYSNMTPQNGFVLESIFPNPVNSSTAIKYYQPHQADISVIVYDLKGRMVWESNINTQPAGSHLVHWSGTNNIGKEVSSGIYLIQLSAGDWLESKKVVVLR